MHDILRQIKLLRQALSSDRLPIGLFLGAGCPVSVRVEVEGGQHEPLAPAIAGLTDLVAKAIAEKGGEARNSYDSVIGHLKADGTGSPTIEHILGHVRSLVIAAGTDQARGLTSAQLKSLDQTICELIINHVSPSLPQDPTPYHHLASWISAIPRSHAVEVFTTNYDLLLEQALERHRVPYFDGFVGSHRAFFDPNSIELDELPPRWARLWKMHGSVNWRQSSVDDSVSRGEKFEESDERRLIHPSHLKYDQSRRMPYLAMIDRLRAFMRKTPAVLITCGYSFSDQHLNEVLMQGLQGNATAACFALLYGKLDPYPDALQLAAARPNLSLLGETEGVIGTRRGRWQLPAGKEARDLAQAATLEGDAEDGAPTNCKLTLPDFVRFGDFLIADIGGGTPVDVSNEG